MGKGEEDPRIFSALGEAAATRSPGQPSLRFHKGKDFPLHRPNGWTLSIPVCRSAAYPPDSGRSKSLQRARVGIAPSCVDNSKDVRAMGDDDGVEAPTPYTYKAYAYTPRFVDTRTSLNEHNPWSLSIKRVGP
ncbi:uncharacterized protein Triagg1_10323 [Trichoderma aggressivum f. europaeum]|uniref:Uncharacterized protein n=1 Tax=Trichoderma aggressivum f. europaeum TaxID=173218 RepID=A0AAE1I7C1_9HYPO|nr:hypothetical protein Triagg1_10323 [Trichoderma aggressivum f. europaeum]